MCAMFVPPLWSCQFYYQKFKIIQGCFVMVFDLKIFYPSLALLRMKMEIKAFIITTLTEMNIHPLLHKKYINRATLSWDYIPSKSCNCLILLSLNRSVIDLWNEVLNINFGQKTTKISKVKVRGQSKLPTQPGSNRCVQGLPSRQIFFSTSNFDLWYLCNPLTKINVYYLSERYISYLFGDQSPRLLNDF